MKLTLLLIFLFVSNAIFAFQNPDSLAYQLQKNKINEMLTVRSEKFGQYDQSLTSRSGIFGLKTKKDMQKSLNILTDIIQADNAILKETKTLLDYKDYQQERVQNTSQESEVRSLGYMRTFNKLQSENVKITAQLIDYKKDKKFYQIFSFALILSIISFALFAFRKISLK